MNKEDIRNITKLGFTKGEATTYLALIETGATTVGPLVKRTGISYSKIYEVLQRLINKGAASFISREKTKYFQAAEPASLTHYLEKKEEEVAEQKAFLKEIIPQLESRRLSTPEQQAEIFIGTRGLRSAYQRFYSGNKKNCEALFIYPHDKEHDKVADAFYAANESVMRMPKKIRGISNTTYRSSHYIKNAKYIEMRYVTVPIFGHVEEYDNKILMVSWESPIVAHLIQSSDIAKNFRKYFSSVWNIGKK